MTNFSIFIAIVILLVALCAWWFAPLYAVKRFAGLKDDKEKADVEDSYRKTVGQVLGAIALIVTFGWTFTKDRETIDLSRDQFVNQQFISAAGLLKETSVSTRIAGLYGIEQIASAKQTADAKNQYLIPGIRAAIGFVKHPPGSAVDKQTVAVAADVQSAIAIVAHLNENHLLDVDLRSAKLTRGDFRRPGTKAFTEADFQGAILYGVDMSGLDLTKARFGGSFMSYLEAYEVSDWPSPQLFEDTRKQFAGSFDESMLVNANFDHVSMSGASLRNSCLAGVSFYSTDLSRGLFQGAKMGGEPECGSAKNKAYFFKATLVEADFDSVDIGDVSFAETNLSRADFSKVKNVEKAIFTGACADEKPKFPPSFDVTLSPCQR
jgi:uncharacterized protein YjbI with pentapeptide repeats